NGGDAASVSGPGSRRCELDGSAVGIAKIETPASPIPRDVALDRNIESHEFFFPCGEVGRVDGEGEVGGPASVVTRYDPARKREGFDRSAALEQQQDRP